MYCRNCTQKIEGESRMKMENDHLAFYHVECFPEVAEASEIPDEVQLAIAKSLRVLSKLLGHYEDGFK